MEGQSPKVLTLQVALLLLSISLFLPQYKDECVPMDAWEIDMKTSVMDIRVFVPEDKDVEILRLVTQNIEGNPTMLIRLHKSNVTIHESGREKVIDLQHIYDNKPLYGWRNFRVTAAKNFEVFDSDINKSLLSKENVFTSKLFIEGNNVTVNCPRPELMWEVSDKEVSIPIIYSHLEYFTLFSSNSFSPKVTIGSDIIYLNWDGDKQTIIASASPSRPLPGSIEHEFILKSEHMEGGYYYNVTVSGAIVDSIVSSERIQAILFEAGKDENFVIAHKTDKDLDPENPKGSDVTNEQSFILLLLLYSGFCLFSIALLVFALAFLLKTVGDIRRGRQLIENSNEEERHLTH